MKEEKKPEKKNLGLGKESKMGKRGGMNELLSLSEFSRENVP